MVILDTDILSVLQRGQGAEYEMLKRRLKANASSTIYVTILSFEEQMRGWLAQIARAKSLEHQVIAYHRLSNLFIDYAQRKILEFDTQAAKMFGELRRSKLRLGTMDLKIAAVALSRSFPLVTRNSADFSRVPALRIEDWTKPS